MRHGLLLSFVLIACGPATMDPPDSGATGGGTMTGGSGGSGGTGGSGGSGGESAGGGSAGGGAGGGAAGGLAGGSGGGPAGGSGGSGGAGGAGGGAPGQPFVFVGSGNNIFVFKLEPADAGLSPRGTFDAGAGSSFLAVHPSKRWLYAVNENSSMVASFAIDAGTGGLTFINRVSSQGNGPAHVSVHPSGRYAMVANYGGGTVAVYPITAGGALGAPSDTDATGMNAHQIISDATGTSVYVPCLGVDRVAQFDFSDAGVLTPKTPPAVGTDAGAGPRHLDLHPNGRWAYLINERGLTLSALDVTNGRLTHKQTLSTVPAGASGGSTAEVFVHPAGHSVYGSNRTPHNTIVHFSLDANGLMTLVGRTPNGGSARSFALSPDGTLMLVANQGAGTIVAMRVDPTNGNLTSLGPVASGLGNPAYVGIVLLP